jgi:hypothetical protein
MPPDAPYAPPLNPALLNRVAAIAEALGRWNPLLAWLRIEEVIRLRQQELLRIAGPGRSAG